jgi:GrpB-like predicted nucleotidyltransferase (UPF0157 family)
LGPCPCVQWGGPGPNGPRGETDCAADGADLHRHLQFRDWLRNHPDRAAECGRLKVHLAPLEGEARAGAAAVKTAFIEAALSAAGSG